MYIPEEQYVCLQLRNENHVKDEDGQWIGAEVLLGFATPVATDKAYSKRKGTVDGWANNYQNKMAKDDPRRNGQVIPNKLAGGFEIAKSVRRSGWNGGNVVWRVVDPRGFELEISSANLASVLDCTTMVNGVIQERCIWGRDGANNILLPENSEPYCEFVKLTQLKDLVSAKAVSVRDLKPGNVVTLESGEVVEYMGKFYCVKHEYLADMDEFERNRGAGSAWNKVVERVAYKSTTHVGDEPPVVTLVSRIKVANIVDGAQIVDINDAAAYINNTECMRRFSDYIYVTPTKLTSKDISLTIEPVDTAEAIADVMSDDTYVAHPFYFCVNSNGDRLRVSHSPRDIRIRYVPIALFDVGSYTVHARDMNHRAVYIMPESLLPLHSWYKVVMHYADYTTDRVRS